MTDDALLPRGLVGNEYRAAMLPELLDDDEPEADVDVPEDVTDDPDDHDPVMDPDAEPSVGLDC